MLKIEKDIVRFRGREFEIIRQGHSSDQLADFVSELINENKTLSEKVKSLVFLEKLAHQTLIEADKVAASIESEAKAEAAATKQEAQEQAAKLIEQAEGKIQEATELAERTKHEVQSKTAELIKEAEEKGREIKAEARRQAEELAETIKQEAQEQAAKLIEQAEGKIQKAAESAEEIKQEAQSKAAELIQQTEVDSDSESLAPVTNASSDNNELTEATAEISLSVLENAVELVEHAQNKIREARALAEKIKQEPQSTVGESTGEAKAEYESEVIATYTSQQNSGAPSPSGETSLPASENAAICQGEIDILVTPPVSMIQLMRIRRSLLQIQNLRIIRTSGSLDEGSVITTLADRSSIINILSKMPDVEKTEIWDRDKRNNYNLDVLRELTGESEPKSGETIVITLRKSAAVNDSLVK